MSNADLLNWTGFRTTNVLRRITRKLIGAFLVAAEPVILGVNIASQEKLKLKLKN